MRSGMGSLLPWRADILLHPIGVALISVGIALLVRLYLLDNLGMRLAYVTLFAAALGGLYAGLTTTILSATASSATASSSTHWNCSRQA
ncbi:MAG: hypothetical protein EKK41_09095 [Hyphomicrobiales bacterium]|nr:MAG: hypothetical protein EKK41_09095 [Hyphomicrobiales bacterium]